MKMALNENQNGGTTDMSFDKSFCELRIDIKL